MGSRVLRTGLSIGSIGSRSNRQVQQGREAQNGSTRMRRGDWRCAAGLPGQRLRTSAALTSSGVAGMGQTRSRPE